MFFNFSVKCCAVIWIAVICRAANDQPSESIIFPTTFLQRESLKTFDLLSNNAVSSEGVVELSRAAEAFSLEYFQVIFWKNHEQSIIQFFFGFFYAFVFLLSFSFVAFVTG